MFDKNMITIIGTNIIEYQNKMGTRHLDKLIEACKDVGLSTNKNNELEVIIFLASNNYIVISNLYGGLLMAIPENLNEFQIDYLNSQKQNLYEYSSKHNMIEIAIITEKVQDYNKKNYRDLSIEQRIAKYEGKSYNSQLDILYEELQNKKLNTR